MINTTVIHDEKVIPDECNGVERLQAIEEIKRLKARYCWYIDTKQWEKFPTLFSPHARFEGFGSAPSGADVNMFVNGVRNRLRDAVSIHHCHQPDIAFTGPDTARGVWAMMDYLQWSDGFTPTEAPGQAGFIGYGHYEEEYTKTEGRWLMSFLRLTRLRIDALPAGHPSPVKGGLVATLSWI